jgi:hypothetical protein
MQNFAAAPHWESPVHCTHPSVASHVLVPPQAFWPPELQNAPIVLAPELPLDDELPSLEPHATTMPMPRSRNALVAKTR